MLTRRQLFAAIAGAPLAARAPVPMSAAAIAGPVLDGGTARQIVTDALVYLGVLLPGEYPAEEEYAFSLRALDGLLPLSWWPPQEARLMPIAQQALTLKLVHHLAPAYAVSPGYGLMRVVDGSIEVAP